MRDSSPTSSASLAPAAGAGIGRILADRLLADMDFAGLMIEAAKGGLQATRSLWVKDPATGKAELREEPDHRTRIQTFALLLAHMEGEPIRRTVIQHLGGEGTIDPVKALEESPALRESAERVLRSANARARANKAKAAELVIED